MFDFKVYEWNSDHMEWRSFDESPRHDKCHGAVAEAFFGNHPIAPLRNRSQGQ